MSSIKYLGFVGACSNVTKHYRNLASLSNYSTPSRSKFTSSMSTSRDDCNGVRFASTINSVLPDHREYDVKYPELTSLGISPELKTRYFTYKRYFKNKIKENRIDPNGVFANNELDLSEIKVYGFDYDYTLAVYKESLHYLIYNLGRDELIKRYKVFIIIHFSLI